jgi:hypothetical protein
LTLSDWYWTLWFFAGFGLFECQAIYRGRVEQTLTHTFCRTFALFPHQKGGALWRIRRTIALGFLAWLVLHALSQTVGGLW